MRGRGEGHRPAATVSARRRSKGAAQAGSRARSQADSARRELSSLALMQAVAETSTDAIFAKDLQGRYLLCNRETGRYLGREVADVLGRDDDEIDRLLAAGVLETTPPVTG